MVVLVVVLVWLVALVPVALRRHSAYQMHASVARFRRQRRLLELAYRSRRNGTDAGPIRAQNAGPLSRHHVARHVLHAQVGGLRLRRRRILSALSGALAFSLVLGAVPALSAFWTIAIVLVVALAAYIVLLARFTGAESPGRHRLSSEDGDIHAPEEWVSPHFERAVSARDREAARRPWVRLLAEEQSA
ncbi:MAG: hypothetical protein WCF24_07620 [Acidimicrobiales bacterium]